MTYEHVMVRLGLGRRLVSLLPVAQRTKSHPVVGDALFFSDVSERLSSSREELPVSNDNFTSIIVLVPAHRNIGWVARAIFFKVMF